MSTAVIFGGTGFVGVHFAQWLLHEGAFEHVVLADIVPPEQAALGEVLGEGLRSGNLTYLQVDVREPIALGEFDRRPVDLVVNFAAVHREPGHVQAEYFQTNLPGARNVCRYAEEVGCNTILFASSISVYGSVEQPTDEDSLPTPTTAYGASKLAAELMHEAWQARAATVRRLIVVRPGVVFGPGEGGNVTRLIRLLRAGVFVFAGNRQVRKAGIYVQELCHAMGWLYQRQVREPASICITNLTMYPAPTLEQYVDGIRTAGGYRTLTLAVPAQLLLGAARLLWTVGQPFGLFQALHPTRVRKMLGSNNIVAKRLRDLGYQYRYSLEAAFDDWHANWPRDWR
jgi:GlcNAc-P-P-Und epimerase